MDKNMKHVVGVYDSEQEAIAAIDKLLNQGYRKDEISVIGKNTDHVTEETGTAVEESATTGAIAGGALGGVTGILAGAGALAIPGIGPIIAAGPIAAGIMGAVTGAGLGGLTGALIGMGIPDDEAKYYENSVKEGKILVLVEGKHSDNRHDRNYVHEGMEDRTATLVAGHPHEVRDDKEEGFISEQSPEPGAAYRSRVTGSTLEEETNGSMARDYDEVKRLGNEMEQTKTEPELRKENLKPDPLQSDKLIDEHTNTVKSR